MATARETARESLDLPDWNEALKASSSFSCSPVKQPGGLGQAAVFKDGKAQLGNWAGGVGRVRAGTQSNAAAAPSMRAWQLEDPSALRAEGLEELPNALNAEFWMRKAAAEEAAGNLEGAVDVLREAQGRDVRPATSILAALQQLHVRMAGPEQDGGDVMAEVGNRSVHKIYTPSKTGLTGKAVRLPSRLGKTPAAAGACGAAAEAAGGGKGGPGTQGFKGILKRLTFSAAKGQAAQQRAAAAESHFELPPAAAAAPAPAAQSTIKQLSFDARATPAAPTTGRVPRHVSFGAGTASPAARTAPRAQLGSAAGALFRTPQVPPPIAEEGSEDSLEAGSGGGASVNSANAGRTPFGGKRTQALISKYPVEGSPEVAGRAEEEEALGELPEDELRSPSWNRLSTVSVPESIQELSKKYVSQSPPDLTPLLASMPLQASAGQLAAAPSAHSPSSGAEAGTPARSAAGVGGEAEAEEACTPVQQQGEEDGSPASLAPTPHDVLASVMRRNDLYECAPGSGEAHPAAAGEAATPVAQQAGGPAAADLLAAGLAGLQVQDSQPAQPHLTPNTAIAKLLAPMLVAALHDIESSKAAVGGAAARPAPTAALAASPARPAASPSLCGSPAEFGGFPGMGAATPPFAGSDGVQRNSDGIPTRTPATVTVRRGGFAGSQFARDESDLAANLFESFSPPAEEGDGVKGPGAQEAAAPAAASTPAGLPQQEAVQPEERQAEFSFFPGAAAGASQWRPLEQQRVAGAAAAEGETPEALPRQGGSATPLANIGEGPSPEILGFYEAQEAAALVALHSSSTPALPKSMLKAGRSGNEQGTPQLGKAQRVAGSERAAPPHTITKELQALMQGLRLEDASNLHQMGTISTLSPVRTQGRLRAALGGLAKAITPVRRSARSKTPAKPLQAMLEETEFAYVPNFAMQHPATTAAAAFEDADACSESPTCASSAEAAEECQLTPAAPPSRRYSTRSAAKLLPAAALAATPAAGPALPPAGFAATPSDGMRTPMASQPAEPATPAAEGAVVEQDASPKLQESPSAAATSGLRYGLRSTLRKSLGGSKAAAAAAATPKAGGSGMKLSPTEQGIRSALRRSSCKSMAPST